MASIDEEDLTNSVDFDFYDPGGRKEENVVFNKVYEKPPPGRQRCSLISSSTPSNKVCFESPAYNNETNNANTEQGPHGDIGLSELLRRKNDSVLLTNGIDKDDSLQRTENGGIEDDDDEDVFNFKFVSSEENDLQSGLDVSISDDTDDGEDDGDLLVDVSRITDDDEVDGKVRRETDKSQDGDSLDYSALGKDKSTDNDPDFDLERRTKGKLGSADPHNVSIVLPRVENNCHRHGQHQYGISISFSSDSGNNDSNNESDLSSLDDDSEEDADEVCCSGDDGDDSTDEDENIINSSNTKNDVGSVVKSLGKNGPTPPRKILLNKNGLSFSERCCMQTSRRNNSNNRAVSSSNNKNDMNCNNIERRGMQDDEDDDDDEDEDDCSSASEMTDVSPLASSAENSPTVTRKYNPPTLAKDKCISFSANKSKTPLINGSRNGFCSNGNSKNGAASGYSDIDMNVIMQAVEEISKDDEDERWKRCNSQISSTSSSSSSNRKRNNIAVHNNTHTNERARQIERENERLLSQLLKLSSSTKSYKVHLKAKVWHSATNRQREQRRIEKENEALLRRLQSAKVSRGLSRDEQLKDFNSKHVKCPRNKATRNGSPFKRPFTATSSSSRNSIISVASDKRSVFYQSTSEINSRPEWVSKW